MNSLHIQYLPQSVILQWLDRLSMDIAADMAYNRQFNHIRDSEPSVFCVCSSPKLMFDI